MAAPHRTPITPITPITPLQIAWLAGLLEGEGCFVFYKQPPYRSIAMVLVMCDRDVVERAAALLGVPVTMKRRRQAFHKTQYVARAFSSRAAGWMMTLFPLMGERRRTRIQELLAHWRKQPGPRGLRLHCKRGHLFDGRSRRSLGQVKRYCRICHSARVLARRRLRLGRSPASPAQMRIPEGI
jgi:hypothetical protein